MAGFTGYKRTIKLEFDYDEIKNGVPNVKKQMAVLNAEFKAASEEAKASGKEIDNLGVKFDYLSNKLKIQEREVETYRKKLEEAKNAQGNNSKAVQNATVDLEVAQARLAQTRAELEQVTKELEKNRTVLGKTSEEWKSLGDGMISLGKDLSLKLTAPIVAAGAAAFKLGADYEQALGKLEAVFEDNSKEIEKWAENSLKNFGLSKKHATEMVADFGALFKGMGINIKQAEEWSKTLTERTMDLANFYNTSVDETITALNAIVTGQTEPLRRFGINMTQAALQEYAYANGIRKKISEMTEAEKVQLRYNYVIEKTNIAVGTTARESDTATGQLNKFKESLTELGVSFSEHVVPLFKPVIEWLNNIIQKFSQLSDGTKKFIVIAGSIVAAVGPVLMILGNVFNAISSISKGIEAIPKVIDGVGKAGKALNNLLHSTQFLGFVKWTGIIIGVALAIAAVVTAINFLIGRGEQINNFINSLGEMINGVGKAVTGTATRGYAVGTKYHAGGRALVGEEGPEIVDLPAGSRVYTAAETRRLMRKGETFNLTLNVNMDEVDDVYKLVNIAKKFKQTARAGLL